MPTENNQSLRSHIIKALAKAGEYSSERGIWRFVSPARLILFSFASAIIVGTILLCLPVSARHGSLQLEDALFTATSAVCVTGLVVVDTQNDLSRFGQGVVLALIQLGGLGIMTFSTFFLMMFRSTRMARRNEEVLEDTLSGDSHNLRGLLFAVFKVVLLFELWGFLLLYLLWKDHPGAHNPVWDSLFHSISAFCNAGFSTFSENLYRMKHNYAACTIIMFLIIAGGLGFFVLDSILYRPFHVRKGRRAYPLQTKVVLATSLALIVGGALMFALFDGRHLIADHGLAQGAFHALFQSVTARTAGFNTVDFTKVTHLGIILITALMFIGGSPGSAAGGIKTTTFAIIISTLFGHLRNPEKHDVEMFRRRIPPFVVSRAFVIFILASLAVVSVTVILTVTERRNMNMWPPGQESSHRLLFEVVSAMGTVGLSTGITSLLSIPGKLMITLTMFIGRLGPLTVGLALVQRKKRAAYRYPEERMMVG